MAKKKKDTSMTMDSEQLSLNDYELKEVSVRLVLKESGGLYSSTPIREAGDAARVLADVMRELDREMVCVVSTDNKLRPISYSVISIGDTCSSVVPIQNTFKVAIMQNASAIFLAHNHPSGLTDPSTDDIQVTKRVVNAGKLLGIQVIDHLIIGAYSGEIYSFKENHPELFEGMWDMSVFPEISSVADPNEKKPSVIDRLNDKKAETEVVLNPRHVELIEKLQQATHPHGLSRPKKTDPSL